MINLIERLDKCADIMAITYFVCGAILVILLIYLIRMTK